MKLWRERPAAVLLDVDGVLLDSTGFFDRIWREWADRRGLDQDWVSASARGRRTEDVLAQMAPWLDAAAERRRLDDLVRARLHTVGWVDGAPELLRALAGHPHALVSSGSRWFVESCFAALALPLPAVRVFAHDVQDGKPAPDGYRLAATRLGVAAGRSLAVDDAMAGVRAAVAAGCRVLAVGDAARAELPPGVERGTVAGLARRWEEHGSAGVRTEPAPVKLDPAEPLADAARIA